MAMYPEATVSFEKLMNLEKAGFSFSSMEKYCNTKAKSIIKTYFNDADPQHIANALTEMDKVIDNLNLLIGVGETAERLNILGSTYKRKAMLLTDKAAKIKAYENAAAVYEEAAKKTENENKIYSVTNAIEIGCILNLCWAEPGKQTYTVGKNEYKVRTTEEAVKELTQLKEDLTNKSTDTIEYWDMVSRINLDLCMLMIGAKTDKAYWDGIIAAFNLIWEKAGSEGKKTAELEHLQFLVYGLSTAKGANASTGKTPDTLTGWIEALQTAYQAS
jgi:hypothetical protein